LGVIGIEPDRLAQVGDGAVEIALALVRECALVVGDGGIFRGFAAALDDARASGDAAIRIVPLASVPVGSARGCGMGYDRKQRGGPDKDPQDAHDRLPCRWGAYHCPIGKGKASAASEQPASAPGDDRVQSAWSGVGCTTGFSLGTFERWLPRWAQGIGSENFGVRRVLRVPLVTPRVGKTWNAASSWPSASVIACSGGHHETFPSETSASRHGRCRAADATAPGRRAELSLAAGADRRGVRGGGRRRYHRAGGRPGAFRSAGGGPWSAGAGWRRAHTTPRT